MGLGKALVGGALVFYLLIIGAAYEHENPGGIEQHLNGVGPFISELQDQVSDLPAQWDNFKYTFSGKKFTDEVDQAIGGM